MRRRKLRSIARRWWRSTWGDYYFDRVERIETYRQDLVPALVRELVATSPEGRISYVGTSILEDLVMARENDGREREALDLLLRARLSSSELFEVLSGAYEDYLEKIRIRERLPGILSSEQIDWLLDREAPHRWSSEGRTVAVGSNIQFIPSNGA